MPLIQDRDRIPSHWAQKWSPGPKELADARVIKLALLVNMPDAALQDTESQFFTLLDAAAGDIPVYLRLYSLPDLPRGKGAQRRLERFYFGIEDLWNEPIDAAILTGTEPRFADLRAEPYWNSLVETLDWAERHTISTVLLCLAAHASVLHSDGIERQALPGKRFGVFDFRIAESDLLTRGNGGWTHTPHSRWNEIREDALVSSGYAVLARSAEAGADLFVKMRRGSLSVHFQGHPEYHKDTLLKEYKRDVRRFLKQERETYPALPVGYFDTQAIKRLEVFQKRALSDRRPELLGSFPRGLADGLTSTWHATATRVYRNWLEYVASRKAEASGLTSGAGAHRS